MQAIPIYVRLREAGVNAANKCRQVLITPWYVTNPVRPEALPSTAVSNG